MRSVAKYPMSNGESTVPASCRTASDSSGIGLYSYEVEKKVCLASRAFTAEERAQSSTYRELLAFYETWTDEKVLSSFSGQIVAHHTDNKAMVYIIAKGSRNRRLQPMIIEVILKLRSFNIKIEPVWVSREEGIIKYADIGSRDFHADDISIDAESFQEAEKVFGNFSVDCFASASNAKCKKFFTRKDVPGSAGMDFFMQKLKQHDNHWIFPPMGKLSQAVLHLANQKVSGVVLIPVWPRSSFFSFFFPDGMHLASWVTKAKWIRPYFVCGPLVTSKFLRGWKKFDTVLAKADFSTFELKEFYTPKLGAMWCRNGGCYLCEVGKMLNGKGLIRMNSVLIAK